MNIGFPQFRSRIHITYKQVLNNLPNLIDDAHTFAFKHSIKADAINQHEYSNPDNHVFGILFDIKGNTASSLQFYLTDSTRHFLRGALYFDNEPNKDSIAPVNDFLRQDIERLIETLTWNFKP
jgi:gliding motility-associated lipoprotein GldD